MTPVIWHIECCQYARSDGFFGAGCWCAGCWCAGYRMCGMSTSRTNIPHVDITLKKKPANTPHSAPYHSNQSPFAALATVHVYWPRNFFLPRSWPPIGGPTAANRTSDAVPSPVLTGVRGIFFRVIESDR